MDKIKSINYFNEANQHYLASKYQESFDLYQKSVLEDNSFFDAHFCIAKTLIRLNKSNEGVDYLNRYFHLIPAEKRHNYIDALCDILEENNEVNSAIQFLLNQKSVLNEKQHLYLAKLFLKQNKINEANRILVKVPNHNQVNNFLQNLIISQQLPNEIIESFSKNNFINDYHLGIEKINAFAKTGIKSNEINKILKLFEQEKQLILNKDKFSENELLEKLEEKVAQSNKLFIEESKVLFNEKKLKDIRLIKKTLELSDCNSGELSEVEKKIKILEKIRNKSFKNRLTILIISLISIAFFSYWIYIKYFKDYPKKDAEQLVIEYCKCNDDYLNEISSKYENFIVHFDTLRYKGRQDARNEIFNLINPLNIKKDNCLQSISVKQEAIRQKYLTNLKDLAVFDMKFDQQKLNCIVDENKINNYLSQTEEKILLIKEPEPNIEIIKNDLIGKSVLGWKFEMLSEFKNGKILNTLKSSNRIEYEILFKLEDTTEHDCKVFVSYLLNDFGWYFDNVKLDYITYINKALVNEWSVVYPLQNSTFEIIHNGNRYYIQDGYYGTRYKGGPDGENINLKNNQLYIMSREEYPIELILKYRPINVIN